MRTWFALPWIRGRLQSPLQQLPRYGLLLKQRGNASAPSVAALTLSLMYYAFIRQYVREAVPLPRLIRDVPNSYLRQVGIRWVLRSQQMTLRHRRW